MIAYGNVLLKFLEANKMGKHRDGWARDTISNLMFLGKQIGRFFPLEVEMEHKIHRGFVDVAWYTHRPAHRKKLYIAVFEIETSKSDWPRIRSNASKIVSLKPLLTFHIFKQSVRLNNSEKKELRNIHHGRNVSIINSDKGVWNMMKVLAQAFTGSTLIRQVPLNIPKVYLEALDMLIETGYFFSRNDAIRASFVESFETVLAISWENCQSYLLKDGRGCPNCGNNKGLLDIKNRKWICNECGKAFIQTWMPEEESRMHLKGQN